MIVSKINYRISILGGGNDTPDFYSKYGSCIVGFGLNHHVYVMSNFITKLDNVCYQAYYSFPEKVSTISEFKNPGIRGSLLYLEKKFGKLPCLSIHINNTLPSSCGIGSSSSLIAGILSSVYTLLGERYTLNQIANETNYIERELLGEPGGRQDPWWIKGGIASIDFEETGKIIYNKFNLSNNFISKFKDSSIIFYYSQRQSFNIAKSYNNKNSENYKLRLLDIGRAGKKAFQNEDLEEIKDLLDENWNEKRKISELISNSDIDLIYDKVRSLDASMKVCGVGGGGAIYCLCSPEKKSQLISLIGLPTIPVDFDMEGSRIIYNHKEVST